MADLAALKAANAKRWVNAKVTRGGEAVSIARHLVAYKSRYQAVEARTGVPWWFIAAVHEREASQNWSTQLGQGDPLNHVSTHVPAGRGPFATWEDGAVDALVNCPPYAARNKDWSIGGALTMWEEYNGLKYFSAGRPSPYVWSGTDVYDPPGGPGGKVLVDHGPIEDWKNGSRVVDKQMGCAALLKSMMTLDATITLTGITITPQPTITVPPVTRPAPVPRPSQPLPPSIAHPAQGSIGAAIASAFAAFLSIFRRK